MANTDGYGPPLARGTGGLGAESGSVAVEGATLKQGLTNPGCMAVRTLVRAGPDPARGTGGLGAELMQWH